MATLTHIPHGFPIPMMGTKCAGAHSLNCRLNENFMVIGILEVGVSLAVGELFIKSSMNHGGGLVDIRQVICTREPRWPCQQKH